MSTIILWCQKPQDLIMQFKRKPKNTNQPSQDTKHFQLIVIMALRISTKFFFPFTWNLWVLTLRSHATTKNDSALSMMKNANIILSLIKHLWWHLEGLGKNAWLKTRCKNLVRLSLNADIGYHQALSPWVVYFCFITGCYWILPALFLLWLVDLGQLVRYRDGGRA